MIRREEYMYLVSLWDNRKTSKDVEGKCNVAWDTQRIIETIERARLGLHPRETAQSGATFSRRNIWQKINALSSSRDEILF